MVGVWDYMKLDYFTYSNVGEREVNEDCVGVAVNNESYNFALCDGLGGHGDGEIASKTAVDAMLNAACHNDFCAELLEESFEAANEAVSIMQKQCSSSMRTTATLLSIKENKAMWGHIGDSRIYYFSKNKFVKRTLDHSVPQMLVATGEIKEKDIRHHEDRNKLLRCIPWAAKKYDIDETALEICCGDSFLMMSDGFWDWIDEKQMQKALKKCKCAEDTANYLVKKAFKFGNGNNMDNLSLIVVKVI